MLISRNWLQSLFVDELPSAGVLEEALTFHAFEIDGLDPYRSDDDYAAGIKDWILDVKVTPNRGHDCLSHLGVAKELAAILKLQLKDTIFTQAPDLSKTTSSVSVSIDSPLCLRYIAGHITGVKVGKSPEWLAALLESIGQRSINNVVDATNYVMFTLGQPLHAFDAGKLNEAAGAYAVSVRAAGEGEKLLALDEKEYTLGPANLVIADANAQVAVGLAGIKGGMPAGITEATTNIILESANFDGVSTRKTAQALKLRTDASARYEQVISPELAARGMHAVVALIQDIAGGKLQGFVDVYPKQQQKQTATVSVNRINKVLGVSLSAAEVADVFLRLGFSYKEEHGIFEVVAPDERLDIAMAEDLIEEVGRIVGYDKVLPEVLPKLDMPQEVNKNFYWAEKIREFLIGQGFSEVFTSVFADQGERVVLNKVDGVRPYMRTSVKPGLEEALERNVRNKELLGLTQVKLFEIGTVWKGGKEEVVYDLAVEKVKKQKTEEEYRGAVEVMLKELPATPVSYDDAPLSTTERYAVYSKFPYIVRDVAFWTPEGTSQTQVEQIIKTEAGELCTKISLFDTFSKEGRTSLAYRLIFQSFERTLTDEDAATAMDRVYAKLKAEGFEIR